MRTISIESFSGFELVMISLFTLFSSSGYGGIYYLSLFIRLFIGYFCNKVCL